MIAAMITDLPIRTVFAFAFREANAATSRESHGRRRQQSEQAAQNDRSNFHLFSPLLETRETIQPLVLIATNNRNQ